MMKEEWVSPQCWRPMMKITGFVKYSDSFYSFSSFSSFFFLLRRFCGWKFGFGLEIFNIGISYPAIDLPIDWNRMNLKAKQNKVVKGR